MSDDPTFRCPVCRARQSVRETCRRCRADLKLMARAHRRLGSLFAQREEARAQGDRERAEIITAELKWLAPGRVE